MRLESSDVEQVDVPNGNWLIEKFYLFLQCNTRIFFLTFVDITTKMLFAIVVCVLVLGAIYFMSWKMWHVVVMNVIYQIKYYYIGFVYHLEDILNARYNKTGKKQREKFECLV